MAASNSPAYTVPGMTEAEGGEVIGRLRMRLHALNDLALTLKHVHWNVVGPHFIAVHEMLDPRTPTALTEAPRVAHPGAPAPPSRKGDGGAAAVSA